MWIVILLEKPSTKQFKETVILDYGNKKERQSVHILNIYLTFLYQNTLNEEISYQILFNDVGEGFAIFPWYS